MSFLGKFRAILLFGPPGSGKGSVGKVLSFLHLGKHISSGDLFRSLSPLSKEGKLFQEKEKKGLLVPDEVSIAIFRNHLQHLIKKNTFNPTTDLLLLDGIPRTEKQADLLQEQLEIDTIFYLQVDDHATLVERMKGRGRNQNRADDQNNKTILTRIHEYERKTEKILQKYPKSLIVNIQANMSLAHVCKNILNHLLK